MDLEDFRLALARRVGATHTINARHEDPISRIREITRGGLTETHAGVDVAFETAGSLPPDPEVSLDLVSAASREVSIPGVFRYANCSPAAIALVESGAVNPDALVTHRSPFEQTPEASEFAGGEKRASMKVMIDVG